MLNLIVFTIVFLVAAWFLNNYLDAQGIPKGMTRGVMVLLLASLMAWGVGWTAGWAQTKIQGPQLVVQTPSGLTQLMKDASQQQP
ncbi:MAG: hypothetical protein WBM09_01695 [Gallionella sp.]